MSAKLLLCAYVYGVIFVHCIHTYVHIWLNFFASMYVSLLKLIRSLICCNRVFGLHSWYSKEFFKIAPTLLIVGALFYLTRKLSQGATGKGVSVQNVIRYRRIRNRYKLCF